MSVQKLRYRYGIAALLFFITEVFIAIYFKKGFIRHWFGDFLVVGLLYCSLQALWPGKVLKRVILIGIIAASIEALQAFGLVELLGLKDNPGAKLVLGTTFSWSDMLAYGLGLLATLGIERLVRSESFIQCCQVVLGLREEP